MFRNSAVLSGLDLVWHQRWTGVASPGNASHRNFALARRMYSEEELLTRGMAAIFEGTDLLVRAGTAVRIERR